MPTSFAIKDINGKVRYKVSPSPITGRLPTWNEIMIEIGNAPPPGAKNLEFGKLLSESISVTGVDFSGCDFSEANLERSSFVECKFDSSVCKSTNFHHYADQVDRLDRSMGTLFLRCSFEHAVIKNCDFVMSKFIDCNFDSAVIENCDFRNVQWFDKHSVRAQSWEDIKGIADPFSKAKLIKCRFGHPLSNIGGLPIHLMIPLGFDSVWRHMGEINKKILRFGYALNETPTAQFSSAV